MHCTFPHIIAARLLLLFGLLVLAAAGCGGTPENTEPAALEAASAGIATATDPNACHLLGNDEVSTLVEEPIVMRDQVEAGETWSTCHWENEEGMPLFILTVYWSNGKQEWETWGMAQGLGNQLLEQAEGVSGDDVVQQGPVEGLGDAAYFSELLPSLVLQGDVLFEMNLNFVPRAEAKFAGLARQLLARIG